VRDGAGAGDAVRVRDGVGEGDAARVLARLGTTLRVWDGAGVVDPWREARGRLGFGDGDALRAEVGGEVALVVEVRVARGVTVIDKTLAPREAVAVRGGCVAGVDAAAAARPTPLSATAPITIGTARTAAFLPSVFFPAACFSATFFPAPRFPAPRFPPFRSPRPGRRRWRLVVRMCPPTLGTLPAVGTRQLSRNAPVPLPSQRRARTPAI
jgi:hypothetical protein